MRHILTLLFITIVGLLLAGCSTVQPAPTATLAPTATALPTATAIPTATPTPIPFVPLPEGRIILDISANQKFVGTVYGHGETVILTANMVHDGEKQWDPFVEAVDKEKFTVFTFSYLHANYEGAAQEIKIVMKKIVESGYKRVACIGATLGVIACGSIANEPQIVGLALISGPFDGAVEHQPGACGCANLENAAYPKLFITGDKDTWTVDIQHIHEKASEPKKLVIFPNEGMRGTQLFFATEKEEFLKLLIDFINDL